LLKIQDAVMQYHDAFAAFNEGAEVLPAFLVQVPREIIKDQHIIFGSNVLLKSQLAVRDRRPANILVAVEQAIERGFMIVAARDDQQTHALGGRARQAKLGRQGYLAGGGPFRAAQERCDKRFLLHRTQVTSQSGAENPTWATLR